MNLLDRLIGARQPERMTVDEYADLYNSFAFGGIGYGYNGGPLSTGVQQTLAGGSQVEMAPNTFVGLATQAYAANGVVFACMLVRQLVFSSVRFRWQRILDGKPSDMFGSPELRILERPWVGGTTQDMLSRMIQDADLAGNSYWTIIDNEFVRMRPDWVDVVVEERMVRGGPGEVGGGQVGWRKVGYLYHEGGRGNMAKSVAFLASEVVHYAPIPDPLASYRGMSWLTPILREIQADQAMTQHQSKFFSNGATVNMIIKHAPTADPEAVRRWAEQMESKHGGVGNAWKNLNLYPG
ncbi:phage portal protein, partial [Mycolicibacterium sp.]|uniref:phage portal protein n=1 Tax=Mycolicibacterium sp. TaxID=2320850 RepID=UPI0025CCE311